MLRAVLALVVLCGACDAPPPPWQPASAAELCLLPGAAGPTLRLELDCDPDDTVNARVDCQAAPRGDTLVVTAALSAQPTLRAAPSSRFGAPRCGAAATCALGQQAADARVVVVEAGGVKTRFEQDPAGAAEVACAAPGATVKAVAPPPPPVFLPPKSRPPPARAVDDAAPVDLISALRGAGLERLCAPAGRLRPGGAVVLELLSTCTSGARRTVITKGCRAQRSGGRLVVDDADLDAPCTVQRCTFPGLHKGANALAVIEPDGATTTLRLRAPGRLGDTVCADRGSETSGG